MMPSPACHRDIDVLCLGILVADIVLSGAETPPAPGAIKSVASLAMITGGCAANTSVALARLGLRAAAVGKVGDDGFGSFLLSALAGEGVNTAGITVSRETATSAAVAYVYPGGERGFWSFPGANDAVRTDEIDPDLIRSTRVLHIAGTPMLRGFNGEPCARLMCWARANGIVTSLDTIHHQDGDYHLLVGAELRETDIALPSYDEAVKLTGETDPALAARSLHDYGPRIVAIKLGADGCYVSTGERGEYIPSFMAAVTDTIGAGDAFVAGFLAGYLRGCDPFACGRWGNAVGAQCVSGVGASAGIRGLDYTLNMLGEMPVSESISKHPLTTGRL